MENRDGNGLELGAKQKLLRERQIRGAVRQPRGSEHFPSSTQGPRAALQHRVVIVEDLERLIQNPSGTMEIFPLDSWNLGITGWFGLEGMLKLISFQLP